MSNFSSFYGGRQGASFIIVKRFDGINIPQGVDGKYVYRERVYAVTSDGYLIYNNGFIEKNADNYLNYVWEYVSLDGTDVETKQAEGATTTYTVTKPIEKAEGMVQCFEKGGATTDIVNYGEYVMIDPVNKNDPDNGKVYRRGINYDYSESNPLAGAEYVGNIQGPKGDVTKVDFGHYDEIDRDYTVKTKDEYTPQDDDIVPGSYIDDSGIRQYEDEIKYIYTQFVDKFGQAQGTLIGFKIPTLVQDYEARSMSPYEQRRTDPETGKYYNVDLISEDPTQYIDGKWQHPFYQKWQIKVPHGYHGINSTNIELVHTKTMPAGYKEGFNGAPVWINESCTMPFIVGGEQAILTASRDVLQDANYNADPNIEGVPIMYNDTKYFVKKSDCYMDRLRYRETDFDNLEAGEVTYIDIGEYNIIQRVTISEDGTLTVFYSAETQPKELEQVLRWIDTKDTEGITIADDGTVRVYYNTLDAEGNHEYQEYPKVLDWITEVTLSQDGKFDVLFNNDTLQGGHYHTDLDWVDSIDIEADGTVNFYFNTDHTTPAFTFSKYFRKIDDVDIQTTAPGSTVEGTGDQRIHITYNTTDSAGSKIIEAIGDPLNYIIETVISTPTQNYPSAPYSHLLVYYADPALRQQFQAKWVTYPSEKYPGTVWTEWIDLGNVRGSAGGIHILKNVTSINELKDASGNYIPPEQLTDASGTIINPDGAGWSVTLTANPLSPTEVKIMCYDYDSKIWYSIGTIDLGVIDASAIIAKSAPEAGNVPPPAVGDTLKENGFWFATETVYYAY